MSLRAILIIFTASLVVLGCSTEYHIGKMEKSHEKAENKGVVFAPDTVWQYNVSFDTIKRTIKAYQDSLRYAKKMNRNNNRTERAKSRHENKSRWKFWLLLGIVLGGSGVFLLLKYVPFMKRFVI